MYIEYDDSNGLWGVYNSDDRLIRYFSTKEKAFEFVNGV